MPLLIILQGELESRRNDVKRLSLQAIKLMEEFSNKVAMDMSDTFQPLLREWKSVQELAGVHIEEEQKDIVTKLERPLRPSRHSVSDEHDLEEHSELATLGQLRRFGSGYRRFSFGSENSLDARDKRSYEYSMDTLWSSSSTFSISVDARDESQEYLNMGLPVAMGSGDVYLSGSDNNITGRQRQDTISASESNDKANGELDERVGLEEQCSRDSVETVTAEAPRRDLAVDEVRELMDDIIDRIYATCEKLTTCVYTPEDTEEEVERKLKECKVL